MGGKYAHKVVGEPVEFAGVDGSDSFPVVLARIDVWRTDGQTPAVHVLLDVDYETYVAMDEAGAFGFSMFSIDASTANAQFSGERDLEITLRADDTLLPPDAATLSDAALFDAVLTGVLEDSARFLDPNAWKWLSVMQGREPGATALTGIRSKYPPR